MTQYDNVCRNTFLSKTHNSFSNSHKSSPSATPLITAYEFDQFEKAGEKRNNCMSVLRKKQHTFFQGTPQDLRTLG